MSQEEDFGIPAGSEKYVTGAQAGPVGVYRSSLIVGQELVFPWYYFFCPGPRLEYQWTIGRKIFDMSAEIAPTVAVKAPDLPSRANRSGFCQPLFNIFVARRYLESLAEEIYDVRCPSLVTRLLPMCYGLEQDLARLHDEAQKDTCESKKTVDCLVPLVTIGLLRSVLPEREPASVLKHHHPGVSRARRLIAREFKEALAIKDLARVACLSPSQFIAVFKRDTGLTPHDYLRGVRIEEAKRLLPGRLFRDRGLFRGWFLLCERLRRVFHPFDRHYSRSVSQRSPVIERALPRS